MPLLVADHDVADVLRVFDQSQAANVVELAALRIEAAAGVGVVGAQLLEDLRNRDAVGEQPVGIEQHLILHGGAAEAGIVGHARNRRGNARSSTQSSIVFSSCGVRSGLCST